MVSDGLGHSAVRRPLEAPAVVIRRADGKPIAIDDAVKRLGRIPGVLAVWPRIHEGPRRLSDGEADDIALHVFHPAEIRAVLSELNAAFPWPVEILTRENREKYVESCLAHRSGLWMLLLVPTLLTLVYVVAAYLQDGAGGGREIGIQKAVGWQSKDIVALCLYRAGLFGLPAAVLGGAAAVVVANSIEALALRRFLLGPEGERIPLDLTLPTAFQSAATVILLVLAPLFVAALIPTLKGVLVEPAILIRRGR